MSKIALLLDDVCGYDSKPDIAPGTILQLETSNLEADIYLTVVDGYFYNISSDSIDMICDSKEELHGLIAIQKMKYLSILEKADHNIFGHDVGEKVVFWGAYRMFSDEMIDLKENDNREVFKRMFFSRFLFNYCTKNKLPHILISRTEELSGKEYFKISYFNQKNPSNNTLVHSDKTLDDIISEIIVPF